MNPIERLEIGNQLLDAENARADGVEVSEFRLAHLYARLMFDKLTRKYPIKDAASVLSIIAGVSRKAALQAMHAEIRARKSKS